MGQVSIPKAFHDDNGENARDVRVIPLSNIISVTLDFWIPDRERDPRTNDGFKTAIVASSDHPVKGFQFLVYSCFDG